MKAEPTCVAAATGAGGCSAAKEGDQPLPIGRACETEDEALESMEAWFADPSLTTDDLRSAAVALRNAESTNG